MHGLHWLSIALTAALSLNSTLAHENKLSAAAPASTAALARTEGAPGTHDARAYFTDTGLVTQDGHEVRFYSDVMKDRVVLINVIYTRCKDACPLITHKLSEVREALGEPFARRVHFISISSDPESDSPQALKAFAAKHGATDPNWIFLTGSRENVDVVLGRLGQMSQSAEDHSTLLIAGNVGAKRWSKIRPDTPPLAIADRLRLLAETSATTGVAPDMAPNPPGTTGH